MMIPFLNIIAILIYVITLACFYNRNPKFFVLLLLPITFWVQLLVSSSYIETGVYLIDIGRISYANGATIRLFVYLELMLLFLIFLSRNFKKINFIQERTVSSREGRVLNRISACIFIYLLLDIIVSGNILTSSSITRFNYFTNYSTLPLAQPLSYFYSPLLLIEGAIFSDCESKKSRRISFILYVVFLFSRFLIGIKFGGFFIGTIFYFTPLFMKLARKHKLLKLKYVAIVTIGCLVLLVPKYNYFVGSTIYNNIGLSSAYEKLMYRAFAQGAALTWGVDREIIEEGNIEPEQFLNELASLFDENKRYDAGVQYLMKKACSTKGYEYYEIGGAEMTGGYPIIWASIFGYEAGVIPLMIDTYLIFLVIKYTIESMQRGHYVRVILTSFIYVQFYNIIMTSGIWYMGNKLPIACFLIIVFIRFIKLMKVYRSELLQS